MKLVKGFFDKRKELIIDSDLTQFLLEKVDKDLNQPMSLLLPDEIKNMINSKEEEKSYGTRGFLNSLNQLTQSVVVFCTENPKNLMLWIDVIEILKNKGDFNAAHQIITALSAPELNATFSEIGKSHSKKFEELSGIFSTLGYFKNLRNLIQQHKDEGLPCRPSTIVLSRSLEGLSQALSLAKESLKETQEKIDNTRGKQLSPEERHELVLLFREKHEFKANIQYYEDTMNDFVASFQKDCTNYDRHERQETEKPFMIAM